ncbi:helix-turn-helix domain-containing protein [Williamsia sp. SKLECPSW1]
MAPIDTASARPGGVFAALLRHWRHRRGLSQLDLAHAADVSARHISFLETGRSAPGPAMVVRLAETLDVPLHATNEMLRAAGHPARFDEIDGASPLEAIRTVVEVMKSHHDPLPLVVLDRTYRILDANAGAAAVLGTALAPLGEDAFAEDASGLNLARLTLDPRLGPALIVNHDEVARELLQRIHHEVLAGAGDALRSLLDDLLASPLVRPDWRDPDPTVPATPSMELHVRHGDEVLRFVVTLTVLQAPLMVGLDDIRVEQWFAADEATSTACARLVSSQDGV